LTILILLTTSALTSEVGQLRTNRPHKDFMKNIIDPKNPHTVGKSAMNLGNHVLIAGFIAIISWVIWISYQ